MILISMPLFPELHWKSLITINNLSANRMHFQTRDISLSRFNFVSYFSNPSTFINILWCIQNLINSWQNLINCLSGWRTLRLRDCRILEIHFVTRLWNKKRNENERFDLETVSYGKLNCQWYYITKTPSFVNRVDENLKMWMIALAIQLRVSESTIWCLVYDVFCHKFTWWGENISCMGEPEITPRRETSAYLTNFNFKVLSFRWENFCRSQESELQKDQWCAKSRSYIASDITLSTRQI